MPAWWHDHDGRLFRGCLACFYQGRLLRLATSSGEPGLVEAPCPRCHGLGYQADTGQPCTDPIQVEDDDLAMARNEVAKNGRCPDCFGYGQRVETLEDAEFRTLIADVLPCKTCEGQGTRVA